MEAEKIRSDLTPDLFDLLRQACQPPHGQYFHVFYYVLSLYQGDGLYTNCERWQSYIQEGYEKRYVALYGVSQLAEGPA